MIAEIFVDDIIFGGNDELSIAFADEITMNIGIQTSSKKNSTKMCSKNINVNIIVCFSC